VPDGSTADQADQGQTEQTGQGDPAGQTDPGSTETQIAGTVAVATIYETLAPLLGGDGYETGGGGGGGSFMFASVEQLDSVIDQWRDLIEEIKADQGRMEDAGGDISEPAGDQVSGQNSTVSRKVVMEMQKHNELLLRYAVGYVRKLQASRTQMATTEEGNETRMNQVH
jgi:hypothetical protein